jgi:ABC-type Fe3+ transport system substrate-binding protein
MRRIAHTLLLLAGLGLYLALTGDVAAPAEVRPQWQQEWDKVHEGAKKEGRVVVAATPSVEMVFAEFEKKYPQIKVVFIAGRGQQLNQIMSERRAGKYLVDLNVAGMTVMSPLYKGKTVDPIKPTLILPEVRDESKWWRGEHFYKDEGKQYIFAFNLSVLASFAFNTKLVDPKEVKSYWDVLHPKWKGKIVLLEPGSAGTATSMQFLYYYSELGPEFIRRLLNEMDVTVSRDSRQIVDWLVTGKFAISGLAGVTRTGLDVAKKQGLPVDWFRPQQFKEGMALVSLGGHIALLNRAPHPNAARVAINWLLSREAQMMYQKVSGEVDSLRIDIPKDDVASHARRVEGPKFLLVDERMDLAPITKFVSEVWKRKN